MQCGEGEYSQYGGGKILKVVNITRQCPLVLVASVAWR